MLDVEATILRIHILHILPMVRLRLIVPQSQLLEEYVGRVEDCAGVPRASTSLPQEVIQDLRLDLPSLGICLCNLAQKASLCDTRLSEECSDLHSDLVAGVVHRNGCCSFALQSDRRDVGLGGLFFLLDLLHWNLDAHYLALLEESERGIVYAIRAALVRTLLRHERAIQFAVDANLLLELGDFHGARLEEAVDLAADHIAGISNVLEALVVVGDVFFDFGGFAFGWLWRIQVWVRVQAERGRWLSLADSGSRFLGGDWV